MIDFRYHLVSIISIFLALAAGIALGAGPLKGELGDQLQREITVLSSDKAKLNSALEQSTRATQQRDDFIAASQTQLIAGRLTGRIIDLVVLPGADSGLVTDTTETLTAASARIGTQVTISDSWVDADQADARATLGAKLVGELGLPATTAGVSALDRALAAALQPAVGDTATATAADSVLKQISDAKFATFRPEATQPASAVVIIGGPVSGSSTAVATAAAQEYALLGSALDGAGRGSLLVTNTGVAAVGTGEVDPVDTVRADGTAAKVLSTVDDGGLAMGQISIVYALVEQAGGGVGHYGLGADVSAGFPAAPIPTPTP